MAALEDSQLEKFALKIVEGESQQDAYLAAIPGAKRLSKNSLKVRASQIMADHPELRERIEELKDEAAAAVILKVRDRMVILSEIATNPETSAKFKIAAIDTLNKMDGTYNRMSAELKAVQGVTIINDTISAAPSEDQRLDSEAVVGNI